MRCPDNRGINVIPYPIKLALDHFKPIYGKFKKSKRFGMQLNFYKTADSLANHFKGAWKLH